ncbi:MAG TPA: MarR family transcriptional regulator [Nocardioides sp.]|nr:MarR family transcriptional regulator [Nocardioides sp.]
MPRSRTPQWLTPEESDAWVAVLSMLVLLPPRLDAQLNEDSELNLFEYLTLHALSTAPGRSLHMRALAEMTDGSLSRISNVVKRLEQRGWIRREPDPDDGRSTIASLTDHGWAGLQAAAPGHVETVRRYVLEPLTAAQIRTLGAIGLRVRERIEADLPPRRLRPG